MSNKIRASARVTWGLNGTIYRGAIEPAMLYAGAMWAEACKIKETKETKKLIGAQRLLTVALRVANGYSWVDAACVISGILLVDLRLRELKFRRDANKIGFEGFIAATGIRLEPGSLERRVDIRGRIHPA